MMKRIYVAFAAAPLLVMSATAQEPDGKFFNQVFRLGPGVENKLIAGTVMNSAVKGAPYSGVEISENTQVLGDGTRIHNESQTTVYRDSEGRVRRETPDEITIWDPVANTSYILMPNEQTARQLPLNMAYAVKALDTMKASVLAQEAGKVRVFMDHAAAGVPAGRGAGVVTFNVNGKVSMATMSGKPESLGKQTIEGVMAEGTRMSSTIDAGAIGNDRAIKISSENWYSSELQTMIKTVHSDPRMGDESFRLTNINRAEPAAYLFQVPAGYQVEERK
jgi:hypothetical protein